MILLVSCFCFGCWDRIDIEQRGFVEIVALDLASPEEVAEILAKEQYTVDLTNKPHYKLTVQVANPAAYGGEGGQGDAAFQNFSVISPTMYDAWRMLATRTPTTIFFGHLKVLVIGEDLARLGLKDPLDAWQRETELRYRKRIIISQGPASELLELEPVLRVGVGDYIESIF